MVAVVYKFGLRTRMDASGNGEYETRACVCGTCAPGRTRCRGRAGARYGLPQQVTSQLELAWSMRQDLITLRLQHEAAVKAMWATVGAVAKIEARLAAAEERAAAAEERARAAHSRDRSLATDPETAADLRAIRREAKELRLARRAAIAEARPGKKAEIEQLKAAHREAVTACRREYAARGLHWGTYNAVLTDHSAAVQLVEKRRAEGHPARLRHRRHDGTGTIAVQLQREQGVTPQERAQITALAAEGKTPGQIAAETGRQARTVALILRRKNATASPGRQPDPPRSPELLASGQGKWRNVLQLRPWMPPEEFAALSCAQRRRIARTGEVVLAVGGAQTVTLPVSVHRMLPAEGEVVSAELTVTRTAGQWNAAVTLVVQTADPDPAEGHPPVALHCGWRQRGDGSVRVGTWAFPQPLRVPAHLAHLAIPHDGGRWGEIIVPASWVDHAGYPPSLRGIRDTAMDPVREKAADWLTGHPQDDGPAAADVRRWRSPDRLYELALRWREAPPAGDGGPEIAALLEAWRVRDRHLWEAQAHTSQQLTARRDDAWRNVAAWLTAAASILITDDSDYARLRRKGDPAEEHPVMPGEQQRKARARAALAAPGRLRQLMVTAAARRGVTVRESKSAYLTRRCPFCGETGTKTDRRYVAAAVVTCPHCRLGYDQDRSAAAIMLAHADGEATINPGKRPHAGHVPDHPQRAETGKSLR